MNNTIKKLSAVFAAVFAVSGLASCGSGGDSPYDFSIVNNLGTPISEVYISESINQDWGENLLGTSVLENEKTLEIEFSGAPTSTSVFDIDVITNGGTEYQFSSIDLNTAEVVTLMMQDGAPVASVQ